MGIDSRMQCPENTANLKAFSLLLLFASILMTGCASVEHSKGIFQLERGDFDEGIASLQNAAKRAKYNPEYKVDYLVSRDERVLELVKQGHQRRARGEIDAASSLYEQALKLDAGNEMVLSGIKALKLDVRHVQLLENGEAILLQGNFEQALEQAMQVLHEFPQNERALKLKDHATDAKAAFKIERAKAEALRTTLNTLVTLQYSDATLQSIFESLAKSVGLNMLFDRDVKQEARSTVFVSKVTVSDAIDLVLLQHQLRKRVINGNTLLIYPVTQSKIDEYEDLYIRTFQITNTDIKYISGMLKSMLKLKEMAADEKTGILVIRDRAESLRLAERLIAAHDVSEPEIMLEVEVLEVSEGRDSNLGINLPTSVTIGTPASTASPMTLGALRQLTSNNLLVSALSGTVNFKLIDSDAKILASPRIRAKNKEPARIMIGDRIPTITNTVTPINTGSSVVTGNVTYQDVGLKLEFESQVHADNEVGIKINLEVSSIAKEFTDSNGGRSYQIGTRNASTNLRLKDGETQVLGGLITNEDRNSAAKIPGLGHIPVLGRLFGNNSGTTTRSEIILAITPRIVRNLALRTPDVKSIFSGSFNVIKEKPILSESVDKIKITGSFGGENLGSSTFVRSGQDHDNQGILINPASSKTGGVIHPGNFGKISQPTPGQPLPPASNQIRPLVPPPSVSGSGR